MNKKEYICPEVSVLYFKTEGVLCGSIGGNTGYGPGGIIGGGDLSDDDDW